VASRRLRRPGWTIALSILAFRVGMLALLHTESDEVVVVIEPAPGGGSTLLAHGVAPLAVRPVRAVGGLALVARAGDLAGARRGLVVLGGVVERELLGVGAGDRAAARGPR
jgi:hypothetical protein